jgi:hypothetical protein
MAIIHGLKMKVTFLNGTDSRVHILQEIFRQTNFCSVLSVIKTISVVLAEVHWTAEECTVEADSDLVTSN